jgi:hypothetical protein
LTDQNNEGYNAFVRAEQENYMQTKTPPEQKPQLYAVPKLDEAAIPRPKRTRKPKMPPIPQAILDAMTELEQQHFYFVIDGYQQDYPDMKATDLICLYQAAIEYINLQRVQAKQLKSGEVISMARQHPGVQMRAWLDMMDVTRKARSKGGKAGEDPEEVKQVKEALKALSNAG